jgi:phosphotransferase system  glucose/maltose/N-acetylglucosamine-specific IIC component
MFGIIAAALSTVAAFLLLEILTILASQRYYPVPYETYKIFAMTFIGIILYLISALIDEQLDLYIQILIKILLVLFYPFVLFFLRLYDKVELDRIHGSLKKWSRLENLGSNVKEELKKFKKGID